MMVERGSVTGELEMRLMREMRDHLCW